VVIIALVVIIKYTKQSGPFGMAGVHTHPSHPLATGLIRLHSMFLHTINAVVVYCLQQAPILITKKKLSYRGDADDAAISNRRY